MNKPFETTPSASVKWVVEVVLLINIFAISLGVLIMETILFVWFDMSQSVYFVTMGVFGLISVITAVFLYKRVKLVT